MTDELAARGYVAKPIAGRCGSNVNLVDRDSTVLDSPAGRFHHQEQLYQELWPLPAFDGHFVQVCTFSVNGWHAGTCLHADSSRVMTSGSEVLPLRVLEDSEFC